MEEERQSALETELGVALAEAADSVWIGPVPTAAVMAGGRRRRARRRAGVAALATLAVLLPAGGLAVAVATDGEGIRSADRVAAPQAVPGLLTPVTVSLGTFKSPDGAVRKAEVTVYGAPRTKEESLRQIQLAEERGDLPRGCPLRPRTLSRARNRLPTSCTSAALVRRLIHRGWRAACVLIVLRQSRGQQLPGRRWRRCRHRRGKHIGVWVGEVGSQYGAVEIGWGKQAKLRPRLVSVPGVAEKFYAAAIPEKAGPVSHHALRQGGQGRLPELSQAARGTPSAWWTAEVDGVAHSQPCWRCRPDRLHAVAGARLADRGGEIVPYRRLGQMQRPPLCPDGRPVHRGVQHVPLPRGQRTRPRAQRGRGERRVDHGLPGQHPPDRLGQLLDRPVLDQEPAAPASIARRR